MAPPTPPGTKYMSPESMLATASVFPALGIILVLLRFYTRRTQKARLLMDDWLIIPALLFVLAMGVTIIVGVRGYALAYETPPPAIPGPAGALQSDSPQFRLTRVIQWINLFLQPPALGLAKLSIIFFYRRVFCTGAPSKFEKITKTVLAVVTAWTITFFFADIFMCGTHMSYLWGPYLATLIKCSRVYSISYGFAVSDFLLDVLVFALPLPMIWRLHMPIRRRLLVSILFALGALAIVTSILRMDVYVHLIQRLDSQPAIVAEMYGPRLINTLVSKPTAFHNIDGALLITESLFWSMLEAGIAVITACLPTLNSLFGKVGLENLIRRLRSMLFHRFKRLQHSNSNAEKSRLHHNFQHLGDDPISAQKRSSKAYEPNPGQNYETHAMDDLEAQIPINTPSQRFNEDV